MWAVEVGLAEMFHECLVPADGAAAIAVNVLQMFHAVGPKRRVDVGLVRGLVDDELPGHEIAAGVKQYTFRFEAVAARAAGFLLIMLQRFGHAGVKDETHVRSVYAHPERDRGNHQIALFRSEGLLGFLADFLVEACVIGEGFAPAFPQRRRYLVDVLTANAVEDAGFAFVPVEHFLNLGHEIETRQNSIIEIRPVEIADEYGRVPEPELLANVVPNLLGGRGRVGVERGSRELLAQAFQLAIFGAKIVAPVADAVGFVDGEGLDVESAQENAEIGYRQPLWRDE